MTREVDEWVEAVGERVDVAAAQRVRIRRSRARRRPRPAAEPFGR